MCACFAKSAKKNGDFRIAGINLINHFFKEETSQTNHLRFTQTKQLFGHDQKLPRGAAIPIPEDSIIHTLSGLNNSRDCSTRSWWLFKRIITAKCQHPTFLTQYSELFWILLCRTQTRGVGGVAAAVIWSYSCGSEAPGKY